MDVLVYQVGICTITQWTSHLYELAVSFWVWKPSRYSTNFGQVTGRKPSSLLSPTHSAWNPNSVPEFCRIRPGIGHSVGQCMEYNQNGILIIMSCQSILSPTGFREHFTNPWNIQQNSQPQLPTNEQEEHTQWQPTMTSTHQQVPKMTPPPTLTTHNHNQHMKKDKWMTTTMTADNNAQLTTTAHMNSDECTQWWPTVASTHQWAPTMTTITTNSNMTTVYNILCTGTSVEAKRSELFTLLHLLLPDSFWTPGILQDWTRTQTNFVLADHHINFVSQS